MPRDAEVKSTLTPSKKRILVQIRCLHKYLAHFLWTVVVEGCPTTCRAALTPLSRKLHPPKRAIPRCRHPPHLHCCIPPFILPPGAHGHKIRLQFTNNFHQPKPDPSLRAPSSPCMGIVLHRFRSRTAGGMCQPSPERYRGHIRGYPATHLPLPHEVQRHRGRRAVGRLKPLVCRRCPRRTHHRRDAAYSF